MRNIIVTGGTSGLGLAIAERLSADGFRVICVGRHARDGFVHAMQSADAIRPGSMHFQPFDLADLAGIPGFVSSLASAFRPIYGLVNNAGLGTSGVLATMQDQNIEALLRLNMASPIALTKYAVRAMMAAGTGGRIVSISSIVASTGFSGLSVYAATKAALIGFTRSLAREVGPLGITANCVAPGFVDTEMTKEMSMTDRGTVARRSALRRLAQSDDVAAAVAYLISDQARNVTGTTLTVDAGGTA